jgi:hypothetical protein
MSSGITAKQNSDGTARIVAAMTAPPPKKGEVDVAGIMLRRVPVATENGCVFFEKGSIVYDLTMLRSLIEANERSSFMYLTASQLAKIVGVLNESEKPLDERGGYIMPAYMETLRQPAPEAKPAISTDDALRLLTKAQLEAIRAEVDGEIASRVSA